MEPHAAACDAVRMVSREKENQIPEGHPVTALGAASIIIPVHNKAALTRQCLDSIFALPPASEFEVIVVDDASTDGTQALLESYGDRVRAVRLERNSGFATACNAGASAASGEMLVFLNNDTIAEQGWLDELIAYARDHPEAGAVGSRLLFPDRTVQHAGVVFSVSGDPLHVYAGFPGEHPAVMKSRRFQAVTAACMLIRAELFAELGGFDTEYHNDLEDVDLCLRLAASGHEVHYCHTSVLLHLESASRSFRFHDGKSAKVYRQRWGSRVRGDELDYYLEDGLLDLLRYSPELVKVDGGRRQREAEVLQIRSRQVLALLRETMRLTSHLQGEAAANGSRRDQRRPASGRGRSRRRREAEIAALRAALAAALSGDEAAANAAPAKAAPAPRPEGYAGVVAELTDVVSAVVPEGAVVAVVSRGDPDLVELPGRRGWHYPRAADGRYRGYHPAGDDDALADLEELRAQGASFLALPSTAFWWLEHYAGFARVLQERFRVAASTARCMVFDLREGQAARTVDEISGTDYAALVERVRRVIEAVVPQGATVLVAGKGDEKLVSLPAHEGWHFPRADDGRYRGYHPADDDDAIGHLEALRAQGAGYLVFPASALWWFDHYTGFGRMLRERYTTVASTDDCVVFDVRAPAGASAAPVAAAAPAPTRAAAGDSATAPTPALTPAEYAAVRERVRSLVESTVPPGATVLVASKGDEELVTFEDRAGWHFPQGPDGRYLGYYPATDEETIAHLEQLRSLGAEYLVLPSTALWWLDHYATFASHVRERYGTVAYDHDTALIFELAEPLAPGVIASLLPQGSRLAVAGRFGGDTAGLDGFEAVQLSAATTDEAIERVEELARQGVEFLVIRRTAFAWYDANFGFGEYLRAHHRFVTRQRHACEIWELVGAEADEGTEVAVAAAAPQTEPEAAIAHAPRSRERRRVLGLLWKRREDRSRDV